MSSWLLHSHWSSARDVIVMDVAEIDRYQKHTKTEQSANQEHILGICRIIFSRTTTWQRKLLSSEIFSSHWIPCYFTDIVHPNNDIHRSRFVGFVVVCYWSILPIFKGKSIMAIAWLDMITTNIFEATLGVLVSMYVRMFSIYSVSCCITDHIHRQLGSNACAGPSSTRPTSPRGRLLRIPMLISS